MVSKVLISERNIKEMLCGEFFNVYDTNQKVENIDFAVAIPDNNHLKVEAEWLMWAEVQKSLSNNIHEAFAHLVLNIGKTKIYEKLLPPKFLGVFDHKGIAFMSYDSIMELFYLNDFNWNVPTSNQNTKEFKKIMRLIRNCNDHIKIFQYDTDNKELHKFVNKNFKFKANTKQIQVTKANSIPVFHKWLAVVKPTINCLWRNAREFNIYERDFFLADLLSKSTEAIKERLNVLYTNDRYIVQRGASVIGGIDLTEVYFTDAVKWGKEGVSHRLFWSNYKRPSHKKYWDFMVSRKELFIIPQARSYKGAFFTPEIWVTKSHEYLQDCLGDDWQREYYIWDCTAGTGNMEAGLINKNNIWASTIDDSDVDIMRERSKMGMNLLPSHIFKFDFLNDSFDKLPESLQNIINNEDERKKLIIYFNPPSAEAGSSMGTISKKGISNQSKVHDDYASGLGAYAKRELGAQFLMRIYREIPDCIIGIFIKLKILQSPYFKQFRNNFKAQLCKMFIVPANTFDNVSGNFPYGFMVFDTKVKKVFQQTSSDVYDDKGKRLPDKTILSYDGIRLLNDWLRPTWKKGGLIIGRLSCNSNDFSQQNTIVIQSKPSNNTSTFFKPITPDNLIMSCIYFAVRKCVTATWMNDRDQFLYPEDGWRDDRIFQGDCLTYALFNNVIQEKYGVNYWIPFTEEEVDAKNKFKSHFMHDFITGKTSTEELNFNKGNGSLVIEQNLSEDFHTNSNETILPRTPIDFSAEAKDVLEAGRELWRYYHSHDDTSLNASFYDIRLYFQGYTTTKSGKTQMSTSSSDETYNRLIGMLRNNIKLLASRIEPMVYKYGFLKR